MKGKEVMLLSGVPATGKTHFGNWLASNRDFVHIDVEATRRLDDLRLRRAWGGMFESGDAGTFVSAVRALAAPVVIDWGFPPIWLSLVEEMRDLGVHIWWFDGDRARAQSEFVARGTVSLACFVNQVGRIDARWRDIERVFKPNIIRVLDAVGRRMPPEEIWGRMTASEL